MFLIDVCRCKNIKINVYIIIVMANFLCFRKKNRKYRYLNQTLFIIDSLNIIKEIGVIDKLSPDNNCIINRRNALF